MIIRIATAVRYLSVLLVACTFILIYTDSRGPVPSQSMNGGVPAKPLVDQSVIAEQVAKGMTCSTTPELTDSIVVQDTEGKTFVMTFDDAYAAADAGQVTVITYCK